jgi:hypothetical protein
MTAGMPPVAVAGHHGSARDADLVLRIELLEVGERLEGVLVVLRVVAERDDEHVAVREVIGLHGTSLSVGLP